jgi:hypothetical protein
VVSASKSGAVSPIANAMIYLHSKVWCWYLI